MFANMSEPVEETTEPPVPGGPRNKKSPMARLLKKISEFLFSQVGLCAMVVAYTILGGFVFRHLEKTNEVHECDEREVKYTMSERQTIEKLLEISTGDISPGQEGMETLGRSVAGTTRASPGDRVRTTARGGEKRVGVSPGQDTGRDASTPGGTITTHTSPRVQVSPHTSPENSKSSSSVEPTVKGSVDTERERELLMLISSTTAGIKSSTTPRAALTTAVLRAKKLRREVDNTDIHSTTTQPLPLPTSSPSTDEPTSEAVTLTDYVVYDDIEDDAMVDEDGWGEYRRALREHNERLLQIGYDGMDCRKKEEFGDWSLAGSMLFSVTVFTTIGYGNIAPRTYWGRLTCICYAMLGIPLMMICLANLGSLLGNIFRFIYARVICCGCCVLPINQSSSRTSPAFKSKPALRAKNSSTNDFHIKKNNSTKDLENNSLQGESETERSNDRPDTDDDDEERSTSAPQQHRMTSMGMMRIHHGGHQDQLEVDQGRVTVPLCMSLGVIAAYLFFGSILFGVWEGWDPLMSAYYCFVTISTIGFGDVVPGSADFQSEGDTWKLGMAALYMLFGMALLSMCINLLQEGMMEKCRIIGKKIGLSED